MNLNLLPIAVFAALVLYTGWNISSLVIRGIEHDGEPMSEPESEKENPDA